MKRTALFTVVVVAGSFLGIIAGIVYLAAAGIVTRQMAILLGVSLLGLYIGFGILIGVYRLVSKLE